MVKNTHFFVKNGVFLDILLQSPSLILFFSNLENVCRYFTNILLKYLYRDARKKKENDVVFKLLIYGHVNVSSIVKILKKNLQIIFASYGFSQLP